MSEECTPPVTKRKVAERYLVKLKDGSTTLLAVDTNLSLFEHEWNEADGKDDIRVLKYLFEAMTLLNIVLTHPIIISGIRKFDGESLGYVYEKLYQALVDLVWAMEEYIKNEKEKEEEDGCNG